MVDATNGVGPLGNQQFSTKGIKLSDLKEKNQLLFDYFKQAGLNENSYVYSTDIEKLKEAYDKNDNGKLSKKEAKALFGEDVSRKDLKKAIKAMDEIALTDLQDENFYPVKTSENETEYYTKNNVLVSSVYEDSEQYIKNYYGENKQILAQLVQKKNEDGTMTKVSSSMNEYNKDGTLYSCSERTYGDDGKFEEVKMTFLNGDQNKPVTIEHNVNGNKKTTDIEYNFPWGFGELWGIASRTNYDLGKHMEHSKTSMEYLDPEDNSRYIPYVVEPSVGVERMMLAILFSAYDEETLENGDTRTVLHLAPHLAPYSVAVLPLIKKAHQGKAYEVYDMLARHFSCVYDEAQAIGKRYRRQDAIGTPFVICVDDNTINNNTVTVRLRDSMEQVTLNLDDVVSYIEKGLEF